MRPAAYDMGAGRGAVTRAPASGIPSYAMPTASSTARSNHAGTIPARGPAVSPVAHLSVAGGSPPAPASARSLEDAHRQQLKAQAMRLNRPNPQLDALPGRPPALGYDPLSPRGAASPSTATATATATAAAGSYPLLSTTTHLSKEGEAALLGLRPGLQRDPPSLHPVGAAAALMRSLSTSLSAAGGRASPGGGGASSEPEDPAPLAPAAAARSRAPSAATAGLTAPNSARSSVGSASVVAGLAARRRAPPPARPPGGGLVGLANLGNTCFMNATLQCLSNVPALRDFFLGPDWRADLNTGSSPTKGELAEAFGALMRAMWLRPDGGGVVTPSGLKAAVGQLAGRRFAGYSQHDAHEFLRFLVEALCDDTSRVAGRKPYRELDAPPGRPDAAVSAEWWRYYLSRSASDVWGVFTGQLKTSVACSRCGTVHRAFDPVQDLQLPIPPRDAGGGGGGGGGGLASLWGGGAGGGGAGGAVPLARCLAEFAREERLAGDSAYFCSVCKAHTDCTKQMTLFRPPPVLVLQLKRFASSGWRRAKVDTPVAVPLAGLDVAPFCAPTAPCLDTGGAPQPLLYDLVGVANHSGDLGFGHYYAHARNSDSGLWYTFNDSSVGRFDATTLEAGSSSAYLLFYVRRGAPGEGDA